MAYKTFTGTVAGEFFCAGGFSGRPLVGVKEIWSVFFIWLVVWLPSISVCNIPIYGLLLFGCHQFLAFSHSYWEFQIIPIDELIFFRGVAQPPTSNC